MCIVQCGSKSAGYTDHDVQWCDHSNESLKLRFYCEIFVCTFYHNYNKIVQGEWLSVNLISALIGQYNRDVCVTPIDGGN